MISLIAQGLYKRFQDDWIIKDFNHTFPSGSITGISGRNGSGKTTLIRMLAGLMISSKGTVSYQVQNQELKEEDLYNHLSYSAPYMQFDEELTAGELFTFIAKIKSITHINSSDFLKFSYLHKESEKQIKNYSSGMKQRLSLALSLVSQSSLVIFDEPTSYLDKEAKEWFFNALDQHSKDRTIIIASNEQVDFQLCDKILEI